MSDMSKPLLININDNHRMSITNEDDLHKKVIHFINKFYPDAIVISGCINQSSDELRLQIYSKGSVRWTARFNDCELSPIIYWVGYRI